jgi:hypothetical protein
MNDNALIAAVLREVAAAVEYADFRHDPTVGLSSFCDYLAGFLRRRISELDPPEKNEKPNG